jgi:hypothetical protein
MKGIGMASDFLCKLSALMFLSVVLASGQYFSGRVGASNDGNQHDPDDIGSAAWEVGILYKAGARYVHHDYADHLGDNDPVMEARIHHSVIGAAKRFYNDTTMCFNDQTNLSGAIANIAKQINSSSVVDNFFLICCGPMEVPWRGIMASDSIKRKYCVCVSHSGWNDTHSDTPEMTHRWTDIQKTGVNCIHISDQNINLQVNDLARWAWAKNSSDQNVRFLDSVRVGGDISDAGMAFFVVTGMGDQMGTPEKLNLLFSQTSSAAFYDTPNHTASCPARVISFVKGKKTVAKNLPGKEAPVWMYNASGRLIGQASVQNGVIDLRSIGTATKGIYLMRTDPPSP